MIRLRHKLLIHVYRLIDQVILILIAIGTIYLRPEMILQGRSHLIEATFHLEDTLALVLLALGWIAIFDQFVRYKGNRLVSVHAQVKSLIKATCIASIWLMIISMIFRIQSFNIYNILIFFTVVSVLGIFTRLISRVLLLTARRSGYDSRFIIIVGINERATDIAARISDKRELGYKIVGFVSETDPLPEHWDTGKHRDWSILGPLKHLRTILAEQRVDEIIVCLPMDTRFSEILKIIQHARDLGIVVRLMPRLGDGTLLKNMDIEEFEDECVVTLFREQLLAHLLAKRIMDASVSLALLMVLLPLIISVAIIIKLTSPGPVLFIQNRVGMNQRQFRLYKFRSMVADAEMRREEIAHLNERDGPVFKITNDPRITWIGRFIRRTSIDELPQLLNVLSGEMSLVGPRPPLPEEVKRYDWLFRKRLSVKPGITCIWQISGRNEISFDQWMRMDHEYIENWSVWLDLKILLKTIPAVLLSRGAS